MNDSEKVIYVDKNRRIAPRYQINLKAPVIITAIDNSIVDEEQIHVLQGRTLDVSISGLGLIISFNDQLELKELGEDLVLHLLLPLPAKAIELEVIPVRYQKFNDTEVLVGAQIMDMKGSDRIIFMEFIREYES